MPAEPTTAPAPELVQLDWRDTLVRSVLRAATILVLPASVTALIYIFTNTPAGWSFAISIVLICAALFALAYSKRISYRVRAFGLVTAMYALALVASAVGGRGSAGPTFLLCGAFMTALFLGGRAGMVMVGVNALILLVLAVAFLTNRLQVIVPATSDIPSGWAVTILVGVFLGAIMVLSTNYVINSLTTLLSQSQALARDLAATQAALEQRVAERTRAAEEAQHEAERARQAIEAQAWRTAGELRVSAALRGTQTPAELAERVTRVLCQYVEAPIGALYLCTDGVIKFAGGYAYIPATAQDTQWNAGVGLVGQCAHEGRQIVVSTASATTPLRIVSALGSTLANQVVLTPFSYDGAVRGVIVLGSVSAFTPAQLEFMQGMHESIAIAFDMALVRAASPANHGQDLRERVEA